MGSAPDRIMRSTLGFFTAIYMGSMRAFRSAWRLLFRVAYCRADGTDIKISITSENEQYRAETYSTKEPETLEWLRRNLQEGDVLFDVGANIGLYSIFAAKFRPSCRVYAFEPESHNFSSLCKNILLNGVVNVTPCSFPLSDREAFELFYVYDLQPGSALHSLGAPSSFRKEPAVVKHGTLGVTLDALVERHGLPHPCLLKLDVDGIEEKILDGARTVLESGKLRSILVEVTSNDAAGTSWAERKLMRYGYALTGKSDWVIEIDGLRSQNYIFQR